MFPSRKLNGKLFYGWVVVISTLLISTVLYGISGSYGFFFKSIAVEFGMTRATTSAIASANRILAGVISLGAGYALDKYGPRKVIFFMGLFTGLSLLLTSQTQSPWQLFIAYSLLLSFGIGAVFVVSTAAVSRWFDRKRGLALGISGAGAGLGMVMMAPLATFLIVNFDWRTAYIVIGLIAWAVILPLSGLLKGEPSDVGASIDGRKSDSIEKKGNEQHTRRNPGSLWETFSSRSFWFVCLIWAFFGFCLFFLFTHLVPHMLDRGFSPGEAASVASVMGVAAIAGRILMGVASDRLGRKKVAASGAFLQFAAMLWMLWVQELWMFYLFAIVYGFAYSGFASSMAALISDVFGLSRIGTIFGALEVSFGIGAALGPFIGGLVFDLNGSYYTAFMIIALSMFLATLLVSFIEKTQSVIIK
jgi:MFS family permease